MLRYEKNKGTVLKLNIRTHIYGNDAITFQIISFWNTKAWIGYVPILIVGAYIIIDY